MKIYSKKLFIYYRIHGVCHLWSNLKAFETCCLFPGALGLEMVLKIALKQSVTDWSTVPPFLGMNSSLSPKKFGLISTDRCWWGFCPVTNKTVPKKIGKTSVPICLLLRTNCFLMRLPVCLLILDRVITRVLKKYYVNDDVIIW